MSKSTVAITILVVALVGSNAWWAYQLLDAGISHTYQGVALEDNQQALKQALAVISVSGSPDATKERIVAAAQDTLPSAVVFEKDGYIWVGSIGLRFNESGHLVEAAPAWD